jgi:hypothetical protein
MTIFLGERVLKIWSLKRPTNTGGAAAIPASLMYCNAVMSKGKNNKVRCFCCNILVTFYDF